MKSMKKGFTLIELLIVAAIIGILAGVGIPMYQDYIESSKDAATKSNHASVKKYLASEITKCSVNSSGTYGTNHSCTTSLQTMVTNWVSYFKSAGFNNPEGGDAVKSATSPGAGETAISYNANVNGKKTIRIRTQLPSGTYLPSSSTYDDVSQE